MPASTRPFMGAIPFDAGVTFRVWAPFAASVAVAGTFNGWSTASHPLFLEVDGYWSVDVAGAAIGDQYKFVISNQANPAPLLWKNDPYARALTQSNGDSVVAESDFTWDPAGYTTPSWNEAVIYEVHVGTFRFDPDSEKVLGYVRGTFNSLISKLDYLRDLGINAIEIMASGEFPFDRSWGYNQSYMFAVEHLYGGPNGFRNLVNEAHQRGIAVIFDVVYNHIGPNDCDLWQFDGWSQNGGGGIYFYNDWRRTTPWGDNRPDYGRGEVQQYLRDNAARWLEQRYCDGLRWDATGWIRNVYGNNNDPAHDIPEGWGLLRRINDEIRASQPWKISIAEDMQQNEWLTKDTGSGGAGFTSQWCAGFVHPVRSAIIGGDDGSRDMFALKAAIELRYNNDAFQRVIYTENHDEDANGHQRVPEEIWPGNADSYYSRKRSTLGAAVVFTAPGIPLIFQGQEFLQYGWFDDSKELDWGLVERQAGILNLYRDLIHLRRNWFNNTRGLRGQNLNVHHVNNIDKVIAFHRWDQGGGGDDVVVVLNFANRAYESYTIGMPRDGLWRVRFNSDWNGYSSDFDNQFSYDTVATAGAQDNMPYHANIGLGRYTAVILSQ
jgi:1,4-alpha-glucan branching enzyme